MKGNDERTAAAPRSAPPQRMTRRGGLGRTLLIAFLPLVIGPLIALSIAAAFAGMQAIEAQVINQLELVATLKEQEISRWLRERDRDLAVLVSEPLFQQEAVRLLDEASTETKRLAAYSNLGIRLNDFLEKKVSFAELFLLDAVNGETVVSTDVLQEGISHRDADYFQQGLQGPFLRPPEFAPRLNVPTLLLARPVSAKDGQIVGVLMGRVNLGDLSVLMLERTGLGETGETYLVDQGFQPVTRLRFGEAMQRVDTVGALQALGQHTAGSSRYDNYRGTPVFGIYRWIPELQVALLAEQSEKEALGTVRIVLGATLGITIGGGLLAALVVVLVSRRITHPITRLTEAATEMASGDLSRRVAIVRQDEIGALSQAFDGMADQLEGLIGTLEQRVAERTREYEEAVVRTRQAYAQLHETHRKLEVTTRQAQRRAMQLETATEVSRAAASVLDPYELVRQAVDLICDRFGLYYAGLFILDESGHWAVLRAGTGEPGRQMLKAGHKLEVGGQSMVGWCTANARARIALDVGEEAVRFDNPLLPETRSEMALPLTSRGRVIGALDVQSVEAGAFSDEDIAVLQTMADQIAVAIDNARLFTEAQARLEEIQAAHRSYLRESWDDFLPTRETTDYEYVQPGVTLFGDAVLPEVQQVMAQQRTVVLSGSGDGKEEPAPVQSALVTSITLRGQVIGALGLQEAEGTRQWTSDEIALVEAVADQMALAVENARLFEAVQARARRERLIREITGKVQSSIDLDSILQATVQELGKALGASHAVVRLGTEAELSLSHQMEKRTLGAHQNDQRYGPGASVEQKEM